jgi:tetratricopeptide (TPR) repeat protein
MAYLGKNDLENARKEASLLKSLAADSTLKDLTIWDLNTTEDLVNIASKVLTAGIAVKENRLNDAITLLKEAVVIEDALNYNEPPDWFFSVRHDLGAVLLKAGKAKEAEQVYRDDLKIWPKNGWALVGLYNALSAQNKKSDAETTKAMFEEAWKFADFSIASSSGLN